MRTIRLAGFTRRCTINRTLISASALLLTAVACHEASPGSTGDRYEGPYTGPTYELPDLRAEFDTLQLQEIERRARARIPELYQDERGSRELLNLLDGGVAVFATASPESARAAAEILYARDMMREKWPRAWRERETAERN